MVPATVMRWGGVGLLYYGPGYADNAVNLSTVYFDWQRVSPKIATMCCDR